MIIINFVKITITTIINKTYYYYKQLFTFIIIIITINYKNMKIIIINSFA